MLQSHGCVCFVLHNACLYPPYIHKLMHSDLKYLSLSLSFCFLQISLDLSRPDKLSMLLRATLEALSKLLEVACLPDTGKCAEELLGYLRASVCLEPIASIQCVQQVNFSHLLLGRLHVLSPCVVTICCLLVLSPCVVSMCCHHVLSPCVVTMCCHHVLSPCLVTMCCSMYCLHMLSPCVVTMCCLHVLSPCVVTMSCHHVLSPCVVTMCCHHVLSPCVVTMYCRHVLSPCVAPCIVSICCHHVL